MLNIIKIVTILFAFMSLVGDPITVKDMIISQGEIASNILSLLFIIFNSFSTFSYIWTSRCYDFNKYQL